VEREWWWQWCHFLTLSCSSMELRMISAASRAIWSWVSVTEAPWSMITTICFDCGLTAETYTGLPTHRDKDLQSPRTLQNDFSRQEAKWSPGVIPALFTTVFVQEILHSIVLYNTNCQNSSTAFTMKAILPKSHIHPISGWKPVRSRFSCVSPALWEKLWERQQKWAHLSAQAHSAHNTGWQIPVGFIRGDPAFQSRAWELL